MTNLIPNRLQSLRKELQTMEVDAIIIPGNDPHFSEYPAKRWKYRKWISGFGGSAGTLTVTLHDAALWVDSRYFIQAQQQLEGTGIEMQKLVSKGLFDESWLKSRLGNNATAGIDAKLFSVGSFRRLTESLAPLHLKDIGDVFDKIYIDRPPLPESEAFLLPDEITGKSRKDKLAEFAAKSTPLGEIYIVAALDDIAWILNLRGTDVAYNPVVISYLIIDYPAVHLFTGVNQLSEPHRAQLARDGVVMHPYGDFDTYVSRIPKHRKVKINPDKINYHTFKLLQDAGVTTVEEKQPYDVISFAKSVKNAVELSGFRRCMITDGIAMVRFLKWLKENIGKTVVTETEAAQKLEQYRQTGNDYRGLSFSTISAYGANGALPHYSPSPATDTEIGQDSFYLVDSGAQYLTGTTDITRTVHFGQPSDEEKENYTLVLKGMIRLSMAVFPVGTRGTQLDILARQFLWAKGKTFLHGTGHGVGHYLNVHEGPQSIRCEENPVGLLPGMVTSNEPAIYVEGKYGIRIENLIACRHDRTTEFGDFYSFETLTLCPIETKPVNLSMMTGEELKWLNEYHQWTYKTLSPYLNPAENEYLKAATEEVWI